MVRKNDFRASGSGEIIYDINLIDKETLKIAFKIADEIKTQSCAMDFVYDSKNTPLLVEISYGFVAKPYTLCPGYWDRTLSFHKDKIFPEKWILEETLKQHRQIK